MKSDINDTNERAALLFLTEDVLFKVLELADNPGELCEALVNKMREIFGSKTVVLAQYSHMGLSAKIAGVCPQRRRHDFDNDSFYELVNRVKQLDSGTLWTDTQKDGDISGLLTRNNIGNVLVIPLHTNTVKFGAFLLMDLIELNRYQSLLDTLNNTARVITLVLKNSLSYIDLEQTVRERNSELIEANRELSIKNEELEKTVEKLHESTRRSEELYELSQQALHEKEILIRELYHRTKNNMQVVSSLMSLRSHFENDSRISEVLADMQNKILTMSAVHQKLYQSSNLSSIQLNEYIAEIAPLLISQNSAAASVSLQTHLQPVSVLIDTAIPCGLLINEVITNSIKHGGTGKNELCVTIGLILTPEGELTLTIGDDGRGFAPDFDIRKNGSMGTRIIFEIAEHQLKGSAEVESGGGVRWSFTFPLHLYHKRL